MIQRAAIENIGHYLARAVKDGNDIEAREHVAYANTMSGYSMVVTSCISEHSMEHAMSAYHPELPHGAGLIMLSKEYFTFWINKHIYWQHCNAVIIFNNKTSENHVVRIEIAEEDRDKQFTILGFGYVL